MPIKLWVDGKVDIDVPEWKQLADEQDDDEIEPDLIREACDDAAVALQDRDDLEGTWNNIFVTTASEDDGFVYIFDEDGQPVDRGDVKGGKQKLGDDDIGFVGDWKGGYYRLPPLASYVRGSGHGRDETTGPKFDDVVYAGARIMCCFGADGEPAQWYGGLMERWTDGDAGHVLVGFDDMDVRYMERMELRSAFEEGTVKAIDPLVGGMVNNKCGFPMAHGWTIYNHHGKSTVVGLLMSGSGSLASCSYIFDTKAHVYSSHKIFPDVFETNGGTMAVQARPRPHPRPSPRPSPRACARARAHACACA